VICRGQDREFEAKSGELRRMHRYSVATEKCDDPLPGSVPQQPEEPADDGIPF
jgi:hypothetical protein